MIDDVIYHCMIKQHRQCGITQVHSENGKKQEKENEEMANGDVKKLQDEELDAVAGGTGNKRVFLYQVDLAVGPVEALTSNYRWILNDNGKTVDTVKTGDRIYATSEKTFVVNWNNEQKRCALVKKVGGNGGQGWFPLALCFEKGWQEIEI